MARGRSNSQERKRSRSRSNEDKYLPTHRRQPSKNIAAIRDEYDPLNVPPTNISRESSV
jgi:hypothetical protein